MITEDSVIVTSEDLMSADLGDEAVVLDGRSGKYYGLNEVGARTLELANQPRAVSEIIDLLLLEYDVDREQMTRDLLAFLQNMEAEQLILVADGTVA